MGLQPSGLGGGNAGGAAASASIVSQDIFSPVQGTFGATLTRYFAPGSSTAQTNAATGIGVGSALTVTAIAVQIESALGSDLTLTLGLRKNGADSTLSTVIPSGSPGALYQATGAIAFAAGDRLALKLINASGSVAANLMGLRCTVQVST